MLFWIGVLILIYFLWKNKEEKTFIQSGNSAEEMLKDRYIRGEISEETYTHMKKMIQ